MDFERPDSWCECCFRQGPTLPGLYLAPESIDKRLHLKVRRGRFCRECHGRLARKTFNRLVRFFLVSFSGFLTFPLGFSILVSCVRKCGGLLPITSPPEPLNMLLVKYRNSLRKHWSAIHGLACSGIPVAAIVRDIRLGSTIPPRAIYAALRFLEAAERSRLSADVPSATPRFHVPFST